MNLIIKCKIKGLRSYTLKSHIVRKMLAKILSDDGWAMIRISGCAYKISGNRLLEVLTHWGTLVSEIREETFDDPHDQDGSNRTGIYCVRMKLHQKIPEWLPLEELRVKIQHHNIQRLCTSCYGKHLRKDCTAEKKFPE